jgi:8-oxo-dGTP pyrophosphatase MutT (NUDIX family)
MFARASHIAENAYPIHPIARCIFRYRDSLLVSETRDSLTGESAYQLPGGEVAYGEYSWEAIRREIRQRLGEEIRNLIFLGPEENILRQNGSLRHEIIFIFEGEFENKDAYQQLDGARAGSGDAPGRIVWKPIQEFLKKRLPLSPEGALELLSDDSLRRR